MTDLNHYRTIRNVEEAAERNGMSIRPSSAWSREGYISLYPKGDKTTANYCLPQWSRDAELFTGTYEDLHTFLAGWEKMKMYMYSLKLVDDKKIEAKESLIRQKYLLEKLKGEKDDHKN